MRDRAVDRERVAERDRPDELPDRPELFDPPRAAPDRPEDFEPLRELERLEPRACVEPDRRPALEER